ncbi:hypothetical protein V1634_01480 [Plantactinospora veratri]|uniref:Uncharacterized protein n=1 Tax=Plantactinospora veratri TaxID=1436122 RepID=A0ABU7S6H5_9ACTN
MEFAPAETPARRRPAGAVVRGVLHHLSVRDGGHDAGRSAAGTG